MDTALAPNSPPLRERIFFFISGALCPIASLMTWQLLNLWLQQLGYDVATIALLSLMGLPYYGRIFFIPLLESLSIVTSWHRNHWLGVMSLCAMVVGLGGLSFRFLLQSPSLPSAAQLIALGLVVNTAGIGFEKALALYKLECSNQEQRAQQLLHEKIGLKTGRWGAEAGALTLAWWCDWELPYSLLSMIFLIYALGLAAFQRGAPEYVCVEAARCSQWGWKTLRDVAYQERSFLFFCLSISLADHIVGYFLTLFLRDRGMSYLQIAQLAKIAGIVAVSLGSYGTYLLRARWGNSEDKSLLFHICAAHLLSLVLLGLEGSLASLYAIFFIKNLTLGAKIFLLSVFKSDYIAASPYDAGKRRVLYFLTGFIKSIGLGFCLSFGMLYHHIPMNLFFMGAGALSVPGLLMLRSVTPRKVAHR